MDNYDNRVYQFNQIVIKFCDRCGYFHPSMLGSDYLSENPLCPVCQNQWGFADVDTTEFAFMSEPQRDELREKLAGHPIEKIYDKIRHMYEYKEDTLLFICPKCGNYGYKNIHHKDFNGNCKYCNTPLIEAGWNVWILRYLPDESIEDEHEEALIKDTLDKDLMNKRIAYYREKNKALLEPETTTHYKFSSVSCPYCKSSNTRKISAANRLFSAGLFGLGSRKIGKQWHCNSCGSDF